MKAFWEFFKKLYKGEPGKHWFLTVLMAVSVVLLIYWHVTEFDPVALPLAGFFFLLYLIIIVGRWITRTK